MEKELNDFNDSIDDLIESTQKFIALNESIPNSDLELDHKLVALSGNINAIIKNQLFILKALKSNANSIIDHRNAIMNIINKLESNNL